MADEKYQGWYHVIGSTKWHYFQNEPISLCRRWLVPGLDPKQLEDDNHTSPDNCKTCQKERGKHVKGLEKDRQ